MEGFISLAFFTILGQAAAGMAILTAIFAPHDQQKFSPWTLVALIFMVLGTVASTNHLGYFFHSPYTLTNPFSSPLSQEIYGVALFSGLLFLSLYIQRWWLRLLLGLSGILLVAAMARVYTIRTVAPWNSSVTMATFFTTAILTGAVLLFAVDTFKARKKETATAALLMGWKPIVIALAFVVRMVLVPLQLLKAQTPLNTMLLDSHLTLTTLAVVPGFFLVFRSVLLRFNNKPCPVPLFAQMIVLCLALLAGEFCGRLLFYSHYVHFGM